MAEKRAFLSRLATGIGCMVSRLNDFGTKFLEIVSGPRLQLWAIIGAAPVATLLVVWMVRIIKAPSWPVALREAQLGILAVVVYALLTILGLVILAIASGLITGVKLTGPGGFSAEIETDDDRNQDG